MQSSIAAAFRAYLLTTTPMFLGVLLLAAPARAQNVLFWQPLGTINTFSRDKCPGAITGSHTVLPFTGLTTPQFESFDVIWIDGGHCNFPASVYSEVYDTQAAWGPAVDGRVVVNTSDPDFHAGISDACTFIENSFAWLDASEGTALYFSTGCSITAGASPDLSNLTALGTSFANAAGNSEATLTPPHPVTAGVFSPTIWGVFCHGWMTAFPSDFSSVAACAGGSGVAVREALAPVPTSGTGGLAALVALLVCTVGLYGRHIAGRT